MQAATPLPRPQYAQALAVAAGVAVAGLMLSVPFAFMLSGPHMTAGGKALSTGAFITNFVKYGVHYWPQKLLIAESVGAGIVVLCAVLIGWALSRPMPAITHAEGAQLRSGVGALRWVLKKEAKLSPVLFSAAGIDFTQDRVRRSMLGLGSIGGGKTQSLLAIIQGLIDSKHRILLIDGPKGDYSSTLPRDVVMSILAPWHRGAAWAIALDLVTRIHAVMFAKAVIKESSEPMWSNAAQNILVACLCKLIAEKPGKWGWADLYGLCTADIAELYEIARQYYPPAIESLRDCESKTTQSIVINLHAYLAPIFELAQAWSDPSLPQFSFVDWWKGGEGPQVMILQSSAEFGAVSDAYISAIFTRLALLTASPSFEESKTRKNIIVIDEFAQLPKVVGLEKFLEIGRSKGCSMILATQSLAQIRKTWGQDDMQAWMSMLGTKIYARTIGADDIEMVQKETGSRKVHLRQASASVSSRAGDITGGSSSTSFQYEERPVIAQEDLAALGPDSDAGGVYVIVQGIGGDPCRVLIPFTNWKSVRPVYVANPRFNQVILGTSAVVVAPAQEQAQERIQAPAQVEVMAEIVDALLPPELPAHIAEDAPEISTQDEKDKETEADPTGEAVTEISHEVAVHQIGLALGCDLSIASALADISAAACSENPVTVGDVPRDGQPITQLPKRRIRVKARLDKGQES